MTRIVVVAHEPLATALVDVARHTFPECAAATEGMNVKAQHTPDDVEVELRRRLGAMGDESVLLLVDVFGATPCNGVMRVVDGQRVRAVAGVNVPMLWRTLCYQADPLDRLVERALAGATQGMMHVTQPLRLHQSQSPHAKSHDQDEHRDQQ